MRARKWMNLIGIMLNERSQIQKATYFLVAFLWHLGIRKTIYRENRSAVAGAAGRVRFNFESVRTLRSDKLVLYFDCGGSYVTMHLSKLTELFIQKAKIYCI